jgi:integrase
MKLTQARIASLSCPPGRKDMLTFDDEVGALAVRTTASGGKSYLCQFTANGVRRRVGLGNCANVKLPAARAAALDIMAKVALGNDPAIERREKRRTAKDTPTLAQLVDKWAALHVSTLSLNYQKGGPLSVRHVFSDCLTLPITEIGAATVMRAVDKFVLAGKPAMARTATLNAASCYAWARRRGLVRGDNPFVGLDLPAEVQRDRVLTDDEICAISAATEPLTPVNAIVRLLLLTAQRLRECAGIRWSELNADCTVWTLPSGRNKSRREHLVPLSAPVRDLIRQRAAPRNVSEFLFPSTRGQQIVGGWGFHKIALDRDSGVRDWRLHDLRRTAVTRMQGLGIRLEVSESVLNHKGSRKGVAGIYHRFEFADEKRHALEAWGAEVMRIAKGWEAAENVLTMASAIGLRGKSLAR